MEKREITKFHIVMFIAVLVGLATIIWAVVSIHNIKKSEQEQKVEAIEVIEPVEETTEEEVLPEGIEEPDFTLKEFELEKVKIQLNNRGRYNIDELNSIINENLNYTDENGNKLDINLSTDNSLEDALITSDMYESCLSVWTPGNNCCILIFEMGNKNPGELTTNVREYFEFMERSTSNLSTADIYKYYETFSYNGYTVYVACDNAIDLTQAIKDYMQNKDAQAIAEFESLYTVNEYGAYLIETEEETPVDLTTEQTETETLETETNTSEEATETLKLRTNTSEIINKYIGIRGKLIWLL